MNSLDMDSKLTAFITLLLSVLVVFWATWPRLTATVPESKVDFLSHQSAWMDSIQRNSSEEQLLGQRLALWVDPEAAKDPTTIAQFIQKSELGSVWFQGVGRASLSEIVTLVQAQDGIARLYGTFPDAQLSDVPALPAGLALAGAATTWNPSMLSQSLLKEADSLGIRALGIPSLVASHTQAYGDSRMAHAFQLAEATSKQGLLSVLWEADQWTKILSADSLQREKLIAPYLEWAANPPGIWVIEEPYSDPLGIDEIIHVLRFRLGFTGLVMVKLHAHATPQGRDVALRLALTSQADMILLRPEDLPAAVSSQRFLTQTHALKLADFKPHIHRVLQAKSWAGVRRVGLPVSKASPDFLWQVQALMESQTSLLQSEQGGPIPIYDLMDRAVHVVTMGHNSDEFLTTLRRYFPVSHSKGVLEEPWFSLSMLKLSKYDPLILVFGQAWPGVLEEITLWKKIQELSEKTPVILVNLGDPARIQSVPDNVTVLQGYDAGALGQSVAAQMIAGGLPIVGRFPMDLTQRLYFGAGVKTHATRLAYGPAESVGLNSLLLSRIDSIVWEGISNLAMPGAQVLVAKGGRVIYDKSLGYHTYQNQRGVYPTDLYDIASLTKIMATTLATMGMVDQGKLSLQDPVSNYFRNASVWMDSVSSVDTLYWGPSLVPVTLVDSISRGGSEKTLEADTTFLDGDSLLVIHRSASGKIRQSSPAFSASSFELLTHTSGLPAGVPLREFFRGKTTWKNNKRYFSAKPDSLFSILVAKDLYLRSDMADSIWTSIKALKRRTGGSYQYSDANMILLQRVLDSLNRESMDQYLTRNWYSPLGLQHTSFHPTERYEIDRLVPTEQDLRYRGQALQGHVQDPTAALLGGLAGHAGLFSTTNDLAIIAQMWLRHGNYANKQWLRPETVSLFTKYQAGHRGLGFDKPPREGAYLIAPSASPLSYGHTGYTGTLVWVDPAEDMIFIFLCNRVHPKANNWRLNQLGIRQRAHEAVYEAIRQSRNPS